MKETTTATTEQKARRALVLGIGLLSIFTFFKSAFFAKKRNIIACAPPEEIKTSKFLTADGVLVEVDISKIKKIEEKISDKELQEWVKI